MKAFIQIILSLYCFLIGYSQETAITISPDMILPEEKVIELQKLNGWMFKKGNDTAWAGKNLNVTGWRKLKPTELSEKLADDEGKLECWMRLRIKLDTVFQNTNFRLLLQAWAAMDVYVDGTLLHSYGNTGTNGKPFNEYNPSKKFPIDFSMQKEKEYEIAIHFVDFVSPFAPYHLKSEYWLNYFMALILPEREENFLDFLLTENIYHIVWLSVNMIICLLFWLLAFQNREEKNLRLIALTSTLLTLLVFFIIFSTGSNISFIALGFSSLAIQFLTPLTIISVLLLIARIFNRKINWWLKVLLSAIFVAAIVPLFSAFGVSLTVQMSLAVFIVTYYILTSWEKLGGPQWAVVVGTSVALVFGLIPIIPGLHLSYSTSLLFTTGVYLSYPLSLLTYVTMRFREIIKEVQENSRQVVRLSEEKRQQALNQQKTLQEEVNRQTAELRSTLENLKSTQSQLIQSEKMASLGELTAGIAHEIQNPLNFVNNFSEVSIELVDELKKEAKEGNREEVIAIAADIAGNLQKVVTHGKRADSIVKSMMEHSRTAKGEMQPTDINAIADEYLRLAYHGMRSKDKSFNATLETHFDKSIGKIKVVPQDIGRVLLNLYNNALYAVAEKKKQSLNEYSPTVSVSTKKENDKVIIIVRDNGSGIPDKVKDKIFQPFFTTKPTGQGTGLGLSLSYDIIKAHGGEISVETKEGEGSEFIIQLEAK